MAHRIPVTVLTGLPGSGKTTLLNRILDAHRGERIAVIVNDLGGVGADHAVVLHASEELFEIKNGCICCTVRGDLIEVLGDLADQGDWFDRVIVETTGMANPGPIAQTFLVDEDVQADFELDGIVTLVDARHIERHLGEHAEAIEQIAFADVVVIHKNDLVDEARLAAVEGRVRGINAMTRVLRGGHGEVPLDQVLDVGGFDLERALAIRPALLAGTPDHAHGDLVSSVSLAFDRPFDAQRFDAWLVRLLCEQGNDIFRMKGGLAIAGSDRRFVFHGVHMLFDARPDGPWGDAAPTSELVLIGKRLDRAALHDGLLACLASSGSAADDGSHQPELLS